MSFLLLAFCLNGKSLEHEWGISPPSFNEQLANIKSHALALSTQWMIFYQFVPDGVAGTRSCSRRGQVPGEDCWLEICCNSNNNNDNNNNNDDDDDDDDDDVELTIHKKRYISPEER